MSTEPNIESRQLPGTLRIIDHRSPELERAWGELRRKRGLELNYTERCLATGAIMKRWYCFITPRGIYIGKVETTEAEIRAVMVCNIEGNSVTVLSCKRGTTATQGAQR